MKHRRPRLALNQSWSAERGSTSRRAGGRPPPGAMGSLRGREGRRARVATGAPALAGTRVMARPPRAGAPGRRQSCRVAGVAGGVGKHPGGARLTHLSPSRPLMPSSCASSLPSSPKCLQGGGEQARWVGLAAGRAIHVTPLWCLAVRGRKGWMRRLPDWVDGRPGSRSGTPAPGGTPGRSRARSAGGGSGGRTAAAARWRCPGPAWSPPQ